MQDDLQSKSQSSSSEFEKDNDDQNKEDLSKKVKL